MTTSKSSEARRNQTSILISNLENRVSPLKRLKKENYPRIKCVKLNSFIKTQTKNLNKILIYKCLK